MPARFNGTAEPHVGEVAKGVPPLGTQKFQSLSQTHGSSVAYFSAFQNPLLHYP
ncbi:MAG: hypothetical protein FWB93_03605 [Oscillospiraceae bacterium]|nr:hypothetical protein [Oscillospiraceae bacterium]